MSATPDSTLADPQELIADLQRRLTEAETERDAALAREREALEQQTASAEVLGVINSSPGDLTPVFNVLLEKAMQVCGAAFGVMNTYDGERFHAAAVHHLPAALAETYLHNPPPPGPHSPLTVIAQGKDVVSIDDLTVGPGADLPRRRILIEQGGARSWIAVALRKDGMLRGTISAFRTEVRPFTDTQIALLQNFAAQAVIAMENARLITETREALEQQTATAEVLGVINSSPGDLGPVFDAMLEKAIRVCSAEAGVLLTYDGEYFRPVAHRGVAEFPTKPYRSHPETGSGRLALGEDIVHILDSASGKPVEVRDPGRLAVLAQGARTQLAAALRKEGKLLGSFTIWRREVRPFTDKQIALLQNFAAQAVIAMENARLLTETREALEQQTATAEVLQVINSSPGNLAPVFDAILEKAHILCGADAGSFAINNGGERLPAVATRGFADEHAAHARQGLLITEPSMERLACGEIIHIPEMSLRNPREMGLRQSADQIARAMAKAAIELTGSRTYLAVPLRKDGRLLGYLSAHRKQVRPFNDREVALLQNFAAQAVIAMENARLMTETREALEQQTATAEVLGVINSSPGVLAPVFDAMLEKAIRLCEGVQGTLWTFDGEGAVLTASRGLPPKFVELLRDTRERQDPGEQDPVRRIMRGERLLQVLDLAADRSHGPVFAAAAEFGGVRTIMVVGLFKDETPLGAFVISRRDVRAFNDKQIALLQNFAAQAVIAMENARLITETREALEQQTATAEVLEVINASPGDLAPVFDAILEKARVVCGFEQGSLNVFDGEYFQTVATHGVPEAFAEVLRQPRRAGPQTRFLDGERIVHIPDIVAEFPEGDDPVYRAAAAAGIRTVLFVPLRNEERLIGYITANRREVRPFSDKQISLLENFAAQAVIAMENARLITETREALEQQTATAEVLGIINSSPGDLKPVFDAILAKAQTLCGAAYGSLSLYDGERARAVAVNSVSEAFAEQLREGFSVGGPLLHGAPFVHTQDMAQIDQPLARRAVELTGARTRLAVPLRKDDVLLGIISAVRLEVRPFSDKQIALLQNFAAQAVIAMENARLLGELRQRTEEVAELNRGLEARVAEQVDELGRVGRLKRFLAPQLAELIVSQGDEKILESHRREIVVVFCDLRGYTAFTETAEPEEVLDFLRQYHGALGPLVSQFEGTLDQFSGDGIMVFFNDPVPIPDPAERAVKMALAMREAAGDLIGAWRRRRGRVLGFGVGIAQGYATLGQIGFADRSGYTAIGTVCNLAARLCAEAKDGQILVGQSVAVTVEETTTLEEVGELTLKGLTQPVVAYNVPLAASPPALRVIEGGPESI